MDEDGIPKTKEKRIEIAERILSRALALGIPRKDVYIDCLTLTVSAEQENAAGTLEAIKYVKEELGLKRSLACQISLLTAKQINHQSQFSADGTDLWSGPADYEPGFTRDDAGGSRI